ncbi:MAG TPA: hypothetical protein VD861_10055 [Pyrinomonadaceae bacterium]|nr:hypothetical protein [Pyrinomonadaceae bacterium]
MVNINFKLLAVALLCFVSLSGSIAQTAPGQEQAKRKSKVETEYDGKKDETVARIGPFVLWKASQNPLSGEVNYGEVSLSASFSSPGKKIATPKFVTIKIFAASQERGGFEGKGFFGKEYELSVTTDSGPSTFGKMVLLGVTREKAAGNALGTSSLVVVKETIVKPIPFDDFARLARSEKVEIKIGERKFKLKKDHLVAFRDFVSLMEQEGSRTGVEPVSPP